MGDQLARLYLKGPNLLVVGVLAGETAREARRIHKCLPTSATVLGEGFAAGFGIAGLLSGQARINLQLSCDGPLKGLFVDADAQGHARGYIKNANVNFVQGAGDERAAFGTTGIISVLREMSQGEYYRGQVSMESFALAKDLERFYRNSEQIETAVSLAHRVDGEEPLGEVGALFVQMLPNAERSDLLLAQKSLHEGLLPRLLAGKPARAFDLCKPIAELFEDVEIQPLAEYGLSYHCSCSMDRAYRAVLAMGREEIEDLLRKEGRAVATCEFCATVYEVPGDQLRQFVLGMTRPETDDQPPN